MPDKGNIPSSIILSISALSALNRVILQLLVTESHA